MSFKGFIREVVVPSSMEIIMVKMSFRISLCSADLSFRGATPLPPCVVDGAAIVLTLGAAIDLFVGAQLRSPCLRQWGPTW